MSQPVSLIPAFTDLDKATRNILYGIRNEGVFQLDHKFTANTVTADGVILGITCVQPKTGASGLQTTLSAMYSPSKAVVLDGSITGAGDVTIGATASNVLVPGLQTSVTLSPPNALATAQVTLDYMNPNAHIRSIILQGKSAPLIDLSATTLVGPTIIGAQAGYDVAGGSLTRWSLGGTWTRGVGQQVSCRQCSCDVTCTP
eukprot:jgi/Chrzof1/6406/Cz18g09140.t1